MTEPYEVFEANVQHLGAVNGFDVEEDGGGVGFPFEGSPNVLEEPRVDQALRCRAEVVRVERRTRMHSCGCFKLDLAVESRMVEDDLRRGVGWRAFRRNESGEKNEGHTVQKFHLHSILESHVRGRNEIMPHAERSWIRGLGSWLHVGPYGRGVARSGLDHDARVFGEADLLAACDPAAVEGACCTPVADARSGVG